MRINLYQNDGLGRARRSLCWSLISLRYDSFHAHLCLQNRTNDRSQFGYGARTCIGKNISLLELTKLLPQLLRQIDFVPVHDGEWSIKAAWFLKQEYEVRVRLRNTAV
jgi:hypothetical protein